MDFMKACEFVSNHFKKIEGSGKIQEILDIGEFWAFFYYSDSVIYGATPLGIHKKNGEAYYINMSDPRNIDMFINAKEIEVPEKYRV